MTSKQKQMLKGLENIISNMETEIKRLKISLNQIINYDENAPETDNTTNLQPSVEEEGIQVIEGHFDGYFMVGNDQKKYPVPLNYSSKTKLVPGDKLKLKIMQDGKLIYKLIAPTERRHLKALLSLTDENKFIGITDEGQTFFLNQAAVSFFKGKPGDELYIITNSEGTGGFAAIEAVIQK